MKLAALEISVLKRVANSSSLDPSLESTRSIRQGKLLISPLLVEGAERGENWKKYMALLWVNNISVSFGGPMLLDGASLQIEPGERIGLLGRNASGKSTLMKLLAGVFPPDAGEIVRDKNVRLSAMPQDIEDLPGTVYDVVASGGQVHLHIASILWLEEFLQNYDKTIMFVTHDRTFLQKISMRIVEIDRGKLFSFSCNYATCPERRQAMQEAEESQWQAGSGCRKNRLCLWRCKNYRYIFHKDYAR